MNTGSTSGGGADDALLHLGRKPSNVSVFGPFELISVVEPRPLSL